MGGLAALSARHAKAATLVAAMLIACGRCWMVSAESWPLSDWPAETPQEVGLDESLLVKARDYALTGGGSGCIVRHGQLVLSWGDPKKRYDLKSTTKSIGATALGVAILDGKISLSEPARRYHSTLGTPPEANAETGWLDEITILHLATQTAGFEKPGGYGKLLFRPGTAWCYSDGGPNWLAECITKAYGRDIDELMFERVFTPLGITRDDFIWRENSYRPHEIDGVANREFGSGVSANVDAMARLGYLYLREGRWNGNQILPSDYIKQAGSTVSSVVDLDEVSSLSHGDASKHYGLLWWNNADGTLANVPRDAFWSWGLYDSLIVVIPSLDIVVARAGASWKRNDDEEHYAVLRPFLEPIALSAKTTDDLLERSQPQSGERESKSIRAPYPPSDVIKGIEWAPKAEIIRRARGSDNWPLTWADDDALYTAYGDGKGFEPFVDAKLSLGLVRITGAPGDFFAENLRAPTLEKHGDGANGIKASGLLMCDGVLYLLARNAGNSQLSWSRDHGRTWTWSDWKFETSFGCPTFLNFGRNYAVARDEFVYIYSPDADSAYVAADQQVLARVATKRITERAAYEFFGGFDGSGKPAWNVDIAARAGVFSFPGRCYRSTVSFNHGIRRYLLCQTLPGDDPRFAGGFGIYDAKEPWGPWTTVFFTPAWDVGPGETASIPAKWIADDGRTIHLVFSGDDQFSIRRAVLTLVD